MINLDTPIPCPSCGRAPVLVGAIWRCPSILCGWRAGEQRPTLGWYARGNHVVNWLLGATSAEAQSLQTQRDRAERRVGVAELQARLDNGVRLLAIDDSPGRYDELAANPEVFVTVTRDPEVVALVLAAGLADGILLDHDMPDRDGREWARELSFCPPLPVVITSTTGTLPDPRPEMVATLRDAGIPVLLCPADHFGCEVEWVLWVLGQRVGGGS